MVARHHLILVIRVYTSFVLLTHLYMALSKYMNLFVRFNTGLFEMTVGVLTCHTQYT